MNFHQPPRRPSWIAPDGRRPSWTPTPTPDVFKTRIFSHAEDDESASGSGTDSSDPASGPAEVESSEDASVFKTMRIDMKMLVGDAVSNMSISPTRRDVVLAARRGLFIIDLTAPLQIPRFLPQGGSWPVADVQWNPHRSNAQYIVSTSSEKLLIWNLLLPGPSNIEHILRSHYRAITDINWHPAEPDLVVSTGVDSWLWAWDLRAAPSRRPVFGLSAFNAGGTQVKWNRQDPNILASSHGGQPGGEVLIWDRRKGSLPITRLQAHRSKIYGIDWSPTNSNELVTCALDGTIKLWDVSTVHDSGTTNDFNSGEDCSACNPDVSHSHTPKPVQTIRTAHPVWRARHLPFGRGVLALPQRGSTVLGLYALGTPTRTQPAVSESSQESHDGLPPTLLSAPRSRAGSWGWDGDQPVESFEGHSDVVKEFVWRRDPNGSNFQLITWSKDCTLRFWVVDSDTMQKVGYVRSEAALPKESAESEEKQTFSFRNPPAESLGDSISSTSTNSLGLTSPPIPSLSAPIGARMILAGVRAGAPVVHAGQTSGPTRMSRGTAPGRRTGMTVDAVTWLSNVKEGDRSSSGGRAGSSSALSEMDRVADGRRRSDSRGPKAEDAQSLQDELTSVINKLVSAKIKLEKHDLSKRRTCTLGLHGPWGESSSVFIRVTFTFPKDYPHGVHPKGTPTVELERNPLIPLKNRVFILRRLRTIRERQRPCLEQCLRFLSEGAMAGALYNMDSESSSSDEDGNHTAKSRNVTVSLMRNHKNLTEPRTSQGTFGPNGELVCFYRTPPRIVQHVLRDPLITTSTASPAPTASDILPGQDEVPPGQTPIRQFQSPALIADAVRRLTLAATDRVAKPLDPRQPQQGRDMERLMTNLLTFSYDSQRRESETSRQRGQDALRNDRLSSSYSRSSQVFIANTSAVAGADRTVASGYIFQADTLAILCSRNAETARLHARVDHERIFRTLQALFPAFGVYPGAAASSDLVVKMVLRMHEELCLHKDLQMLAMLSMIVLQGCRKKAAPASSVKSPPIRGTPTPRNGPVDYFSISRSTSTASRISPVSPTWPRLNTASPPIAPAAPALSTSGSSRGSWSSLFNAGSVRQFMSGVQDTFMTPSELPTSIPVPKSDRFQRGP
ncbi:WD-REPEATS-REGION domain-containing protein [Mycena chlorophos]|uniref:WD-REPEATS-REGION domain-containing protein n=1 Tax=Mycena chlorophos TaxID=658473 RepID=A0A8H6T1J9_MYCCL|nr:WD-REPEATS-REGION domain-containing protein [Mycena chlorophos]